MTIKLFSFTTTGLCAAAVLLFSGCASTPDRAHLRLDGGFISYQAWMMKLNERDWHRELDAMQRAGMRTVILQHLAYEESRFIPDSAQSPDPTEIILEYADSHGMAVFVGLSNDADWWQSRQWNTNLVLLAARNVALADEIWTRYGSHPSFAGWYLPHEMWEGPFTEEQVALARQFFRTVGDHCKSLSPGAPKPTAISPFHKARVTPDQVEKLYADFLRGSGVDILMPQDGIGGKGWDDQIEEKVVPYFRAFERACRANQIELWGNIECFKLAGRSSSGKKLLVPADADRINRQITAVSPFVRRCVTYDFFHFMSPYRPDERAKQLYDDYLKLNGQN